MQILSREDNNERREKQKFNFAHECELYSLIGFPLEIAKFKFKNIVNFF